MAGQEPGVKKMPDWLRKHKFHDLINPQGICKLDSLTYTMNLDKVSRVRNADSIVTYSKEQVKILEKVLSEKKIPIVIGVIAVF